jgi:hypothetical protein
MSRIKTYTVPLTIADESTTISATLVPVTGILRGLAVTAGALDSSDTYTVAITDKHGITVFTRGTLAESSTTTIWADKYGGTAEYQPLCTPIAGPVTVTITASAEQNDAAVAFIVYLYFE